MYPMGDMSPLQDGQFPPAGIEVFDPWHLPLINTLILLCSGAAATWAHHAIAHDEDRKSMVQGLVIAVGLGVLFTVFQAYEYQHAAFGFSGNIYGANFFYGHWFSWFSCHRWYNFPCDLYAASNAWTLHQGSAPWF